MHQIPFEIIAEIDFAIMMDLHQNQGRLRLKVQGLFTVNLSRNFEIAICAICVVTY